MKEVTSTGLGHFLNGLYFVFWRKETLVLVAEDEHRKIANDRLGKSVIGYIRSPS